MKARAWLLVFVIGMMTLTACGKTTTTVTKKSDVIHQVVDVGFTEIIVVFKFLTDVDIQKDSQKKHLYVSIVSSPTIEAKIVQSFNMVIDVGKYFVDRDITYNLYEQLITHNKNTFFIKQTAANKPTINKNYPRPRDGIRYS